MNEAIAAAARLIAAADGLVIAAGAGMGVDSGLPDFRGSEGFWRAYPALARARMRFEEIACPDAFHADPELAWGFYGHRLALYRATAPHPGFALLKAIGERLPLGSFVFTSNVDGQFQKAGFDAQRIHECHGSIHHMQCLRPCSDRIWEANFAPAVDAARCRMTSPLPSCPACGSLARPNVLMFGDGGWIGERSAAQEDHLRRWLRQCQRPVVVELGAGIHVPTVRRFGERLGAPLIRINPQYPQLPAGTRGVALPLTAAEALSGLRSELAAAAFLPA